MKHPISRFKVGCFAALTVLLPALAQTVAKQHAEIPTSRGSMTAAAKAAHTGSHGPQTLYAHLFTPPAYIKSEETSRAVPPLREAGGLIFDSDFEHNQLEGWTIIDGNGDGDSWEIDGAEIKCKYNSSSTMDDWAMSPAIALEAGLSYPVSVRAYAASNSYPECLEVKAGTSPTVEEMTMTLVNPSELTADVITFDTELTPTVSGNYHIGLHGISEPDRYYLHVMYVTVGAGVVKNGPSKVTDLAAEPDINGALNCEISFSAPSLSADLSPLEKLDKIDVKRNDELIKTFANPQPGKPLSFVDEVNESGVYTYTVTPYSDGETGPAESAQCYIGFTVPDTPGNFTASHTEVQNEVKLEWNPVTTDVNGKIFPDGKVTYTVMEYVDGQYNVLAENQTGCTFTFTPIVDDGQRFVQCSVYARTDDRNSQQAATMIAVGEPYVNFAESFADGQFHYNWAIEHIGYGYFDPFTDASLRDLKSADGDNGFVGIYGNQDCGLYVYSGLISLGELENPALTFYLCNHGADNQDEVGIAINCIDESGDSGFVTQLEGIVKEICDGIGGWNKIIVPLKEFTGKTIQFRITGITRSYTYKYFDNFRIESTPEKDMAAISVKAPESAAWDSDYEIVATVRNEGTLPLRDIKLTLFADGKECDETLITDEVKPGKIVTRSFAATMPALAETSVSYKVTVSTEGDEVEENNTSESIYVSPIVNGVPAPLSLNGSCSDTGIELRWSEPDLNSKVDVAVNDSFENGEAFTDKCGAWTFVDVDDAPLGNPSGIDIPGHVGGETKASFRVWDNESIDVDFTFNARTGNKYLFSLYRADDGKADDWAISPELSGEAQTVSVYAASYHESFLEYIELYYSDGSLNPEDFVKVEDAEGTVPGPTGNTQDTFKQGWTLYSAELPEGAKRFAVRSCATGAFMLMLDDVSYIPAPGYYADATINGYNIYRNGERLNDELLTECAYTDEQVANKNTYSYVVTAVYDRLGESRASGDFTLYYEQSGIQGIEGSEPTATLDGRSIIITNPTGEAISIISADGMTIYNNANIGTTRIEITPGVYIVSASHKIVKMIVR